ncbi:MAG: DUF2470 domain-containing protein [Deltaproteobacteria bacterium]|nr:DUF2470 domain-containing protein [Deltaproteobacteria bacterium]
MADDIQEPDADQNAIDEAAEQARKATPAQDARQWLLDVKDATLCTTSTQGAAAGFPFGSVVPFALDEKMQPVIYTARIAAHTQNLKNDNRASLFIRQAGLEGDPQAEWRLTVLGHFSRLVEEHIDVKDGEPVDRVSKEELDEIRARYLERVPSAWKYDETHAFSFWRMSEVKRVRYIAGFGKICWLNGDEVLLDDDDEEFAKAAFGAVRHMNEEHQNNMVEMVRGFSGHKVDSATMLSLDKTGVTLETGGPINRVRLSFDKVLKTEDIRKEVVALLQKARA